MECNYVLAMGAYREDIIISIRGSKSQKYVWGMLQEFSSYMYIVYATWSPATSSLPLCQYSGSALGPYQSKTAATSGCALHIILCTDACRHMSQTHTYTHTQRHRCMLGWMHP